MSDADREQLRAQFERKTEESKAGLAASDGEEYEAFTVKDRRQVSLHIRPVKEPYLSAKYNYLLYVMADPSGKRLDIVFSFALVTITGHHLLAIEDAISNERCAFVQQFDPKHWPKPKDDSLPFIETIQYRMTLPQEVTEKKETV